MFIIGAFTWAALSPETLIAADISLYLILIIAVGALWCVILMIAGRWKMAGSVALGVAMMFLVDSIATFSINNVSPYIGHESSADSRITKR
jgi:Na+/phosphate symporter